MKYKHIFFDLDNTIWDFKANCLESLSDILLNNKLLKVVNTVHKFYNVYNKYNEQLWEKFRKSMISKEELRKIRFELTLNDFGIKNNELAAKFNSEYMEQTPLKKNVLPYTHEVLSYLKKKYSLHIITNGFTKTQMIKIQNSDLEQYFTKIITAESIGTSKPGREIFQYALSGLNAKKKESIMVGDNLEIDIIGARNFGIDQAYLNRHKHKHNEKITYEMSSLLELKEIL